MTRVKSEPAAANPAETSRPEAVLRKPGTPPAHGHGTPPLHHPHPHPHAVPPHYYPSPPPPPQHQLPVAQTVPQPSALASLEAMKPMGFQPSPYFQPAAPPGSPGQPPVQHLNYGQPHPPPHHYGGQPLGATMTPLTPMTSAQPMAESGLSSALSSAIQDPSQDFHQL